MPLGFWTKFPFVGKLRRTKKCTNKIEAFRWVTYTHISHTNSGKKDNETPLFDLGKYYEKDGKIMIPISVQAHHSFVDGLHIGWFVEELQKYFREC